jgi:hypothetical protein
VPEVGISQLNENGVYKPEPAVEPIDTFVIYALFSETVLITGSVYRG